MDANLQHILRTVGWSDKTAITLILKEDIMEKQGLPRRDFLKFGAMAGVAVAATAALPRFSWANVRQVDLDQCLAMGPTEMARSSKLVKDSWDYLRVTSSTIDNPGIRKIVLEILDNPAPTIMTDLMDPANKKAVYEELTAKGLIKDVSAADFLPKTTDPNKAVFPFMAAPGSGYTSHHSYPGGVVTHTALNVMVSLALYDGYKNTYGYELERDVVIGSQVLHDLHKSWVFQWGADGESRTELPLAGTGEHHTYSVAESFYRGLPADFVVAQACAHNHAGWDNDEAKVVGWLKAASILIGIDPVEKGLLADSGKTLPLPRRMEGFVCHLGDHDWILTVPAAKWLIPEMKKLAVSRYGMTETDLKGRKFNQFRNYAFSQATIMALYNIYSTKGSNGLEKAVAEIIKPA